MSKLHLLHTAHKNKQAMPAFNVSAIETLQAIFKKSSEYNYPVFIETSRWEAEHLTPELLVDICKSLWKTYNIEYILHLDRGNDLDFMERCLKAGYDSISAEFWKDLSFDKNVELSKKARELTYTYDAILEWVMEVVPIVYYKDKLQTHMDITDPELSKKFVKEVQPDLLVVSIWTQSWGLKDIKEVRFDILETMNKQFPELPFILHWGSFLEETVVKKCIDLWIAKININSEVRYAYSNILKKNIQNNPEEYAPYRLLSWVQDNIETVVEEKIRMFGNKA